MVEWRELHKKSTFVVFLGGLISFLSLLNKAFGWFRSFDWLRLNAPSVWAFLVTSTVEYTLIVLGLALAAVGLQEIWKFKTKARSQVHGGTVLDRNQTSGDYSPVAAGNVIQNIYHHLAYNDKADSRLTLVFDPDDAQCVRLEAGIPREYRVKVINTTGTSVHDVHVQLEDSVPELINHVGVDLRRRHGNSRDSSRTLPDGASEYFNFLEYNPFDQSIDRPVLHLCHTAETVPINLPVNNYEFTLKAYSNELTSDSITLVFEQLFQSSSLVLLRSGM